MFAVVTGAFGETRSAYQGNGEAFTISGTLPDVDHLAMHGAWLKVPKNALATHIDASAQLPRIPPFVDE